MDGAEVVLAVNISVAAIFVFGHAIIAVANRGQRAALWFSASYLVGMLSPISDFLVPIVGAPVVFEWLSYTSFLLALLSASASFGLYHRRSIPWAAMGAIFAVSVVVRAIIWDLPRDNLWAGMAYQLPFAIASLLALRAVLRAADRRPLHLLLVGLYGVIALHFLVKPFIAASFGAGLTLEGYTKTAYALLSQASTGILLLISGVVLLLIVAQKAITDSMLASETDPMTGLLNRRGFERCAREALARAERKGSSVSLALFDLDHFKVINDTYGHDVGDQVIVEFAALLHENAPAAAVTARMGGEEFAMLLEGATAQAAWLHAEAIRLGAAAACQGEYPAATISAGVAELGMDEALTGLLRRADLASYEAKRQGRDRVCLAIEAAEPSAGPGNVVPLVGRGPRRGASAAARTSDQSTSAGKCSRHAALP